MRCCYCNKSEAVKSYKREKQGKKESFYYCLACYEKLFLCVKAGEGDYSTCPYCGTLKEELERSKIVGCAYCYQTLQSFVIPMIVKMQGNECGHRGKDPMLSETSERVYAESGFSVAADRDELRKELRKIERFERQKKELNALAEYLKKKDYDRKREYEKKLERMIRTGEVEEEIVW